MSLHSRAHDLQPDLARAETIKLGDTQVRKRGLDAQTIHGEHKPLAAHVMAVGMAQFINQRETAGISNPGFARELWAAPQDLAQRLESENLSCKRKSDSIVWRSRQPTYTDT